MSKDPMGRGHDNMRFGGKGAMTHGGGHSGHPIHHKRARGGGVDNESDPGKEDPKGEGHEDMRDYKGKEESYAGTGSDTEKEAERRKRGGRRAAGGKAPAAPAKARVKTTKVPALAVGGSPSRHMRLDRSGRRRGGSVGADSHPLTEANKLTEAEGEKHHYGSLNPEDD